jgi:UDP-N-acetylglucosamine acyltransferase
MSTRSSALIHPTAIVSEEAQLADDVRVGPFAVIEGPVVVGSGTVIDLHAHLVGPVTIGANNVFGKGVVIGGAPQHLAYKGERTDLEIGDGNTFREYVTVHRGMPRGTGPGTGLTSVGHRNLFMVASHVAHDCRVGNECIFANSAMLAGHVEVGDRALISGNSAVHQFCRVGRLGLLSGASATSKDIPPFWIMQDINQVCGVNTVGMRRAGIPSPEIQAVRRAFAMVYIERVTLPVALLRMEAELGQFACIRELVAFIRSSKRGIAGPHRYKMSEDEAAA